MRRRTSDFSLIKLMVTVGVLALVLGVGFPALADLHLRMRADTAYHQLTATLMSARPTAITRGHLVTVRLSRDGRQCCNDLVSEDDWIIFSDPARTGTPGRRCLSAAAHRRRGQRPQRA